MKSTNTFTCMGLVSFAAILTLTPSGRAATLEANDPAAVFATDQPATTSPDAEQVAREVLRLQEELGGSIVTDFSESAYPKTTSPPCPQPTVIHALRETAWRLDQSAYLLESLDLYSQADALRTTATRLRQDARKIKSEQKPVESAAHTN